MIILKDINITNLVVLILQIIWHHNLYSYGSHVLYHDSVKLYFMDSKLSAKLCVTFTFLETFVHTLGQHLINDTFSFIFG